MKSIGNIIVTLLFVFIVLYGAVLIFNQAGANNVLDDKSIQIISQYDTELVTLTSGVNDSYNSNKNITGYEPESKDVGTEAKEFFETKDKINQLKSTANLALKIPNLLFLAIPFVDQSDLTVYKLVAVLLLGITIFVAFIAAIFGKFWGSSN